MKVALEKSSTLLKINLLEGAFSEHSYSDEFGKLQQ